MTWLDVFKQARPLGRDEILIRLQKKKEAAKTPFEKLHVEEAIAEHCGSSKAVGSSIITHNIQARFVQILKIPELPDPDKDFFI